MSTLVCSLCGGCENTEVFISPLRIGVGEGILNFTENFVSKKRENCLAFICSLPMDNNVISIILLFLMFVNMRRETLFFLLTKMNHSLLSGSHARNRGDPLVPPGYIFTLFKILLILCSVEYLMYFCGI